MSTILKCIRVGLVALENQMFQKLQGKKATALKGSDDRVIHSNVEYFDKYKKICKIIKYNIF